MSDAIAIILIIALSADTLANIARMIGVIAAMRQQERLFKADHSEKEKMAQEIIEAMKEAKE